MRKTIILISFILICLSTSLAYAHDTTELFVSPFYVDEGPFVWIPSSIGTLIFIGPSLLVGVTAGCVGFIVGLPFCKAKEFWHSLHWTGGVLLYAGNTLTGGPFYLLKKSLYDFPKWLLSENDDKVESAHLKVIGGNIN